MGEEHGEGQMLEEEEIGAQRPEEVLDEQKMTIVYSKDIYNKN